MRNNFFKELRKYWFCVLLSVIMVIGISYADKYEIKNEFYKVFLYLIYVIPLYSFVYGCLSYAILRKRLFPQLILYTITFLYFFSADLIIYKEIDGWINNLIFSLWPVLFSFIGTIMTAYICGMIKFIRENKLRK